MARTLQVRNLPDDVHEILRSRAERAGMSLSQYVSRELQLIAGRRTLDEVFAEVQKRGTRLSAEEIVEAVHEARAQRS